MQRPVHLYQSSRLPLSNRSHPLRLRLQSDLDPLRHHMRSNSTSCSVTRSLSFDSLLAAYNHDRLDISQSSPPAVHRSARPRHHRHLSRRPSCPPPLPAIAAPDPAEKWHATPSPQCQQHISQISLVLSTEPSRQPLTDILQDCRHKYQRPRTSDPISTCPCAPS